LAILNMILAIVAVALGLSFVIIIHELGHFLLAKWNGVKVEAFSLGLGPMVWGVRYGDTTYGISAFPLGGYVKMLGEDSDEEKETSADPRAYHNKSVPARMAIISAGVIMNMILGFFCFVFVFARGGLPEIPARLGVVVAGGAAYEAGVRAGDEIVAIDGARDVTYNDLWRTVLLSGAGQVIHLELRRPGAASRVRVDVEPRREPGSDKPTIGIAPMADLTLDKPPVLWPPGPPGPARPRRAPWRRPDRRRRPARPDARAGRGRLPARPPPEQVPRPADRPDGRAQGR
jgi:regulator of sigma E protease